MRLALNNKIQVECFEVVNEAEKRSVSIIIADPGKASADTSPNLRIKDLENKIENVMKALRVECYPPELHCLGKSDPTRPRRVKLVFSSHYYWCLTSANTRLLKFAGS